MNVFIKAVITGFGFSLGRALFEYTNKRLGFEDSPDDKKEPKPVVEETADDDGDGDDDPVPQPDGVSST